MVSTADADGAPYCGKQQLPRSWRSLVIREVPSSVEECGIHRSAESHCCWLGDRQPSHIGTVAAAVTAASKIS